MKQLVPNKLQHLAFVMDGNGRWAERHGKARTTGHWKGAQNVRRVLTYLKEIQVPTVTLYAFSTENWNRVGYEVSVIMRLLKKFTIKEVDEFVRQDVQVRFIGRRDRLSESLLQAMINMEQKTRNCKSMLLQIAVDYGGRDDLVRAFNRLKDSGTEATEESISKSLDTEGVVDPDLVIRTGGNKRVSNFMLWQIAYAEIHFTDTLWPDLTTAEIQKIIALYFNTERRFGSIPV